jgi:hypothetical protein
MINQIAALIKRTMVRLLYPPGGHTEDAFLRVLSELAKLTQQSKGELLANALNLYYRAVTLPAADLELLRSFLEDLEKKQGIDWSATANPPPAALRLTVATASR